MDKETLIRGLNLDLSHEYQAVIMYTTYGSRVSGIHRRELRAFFEAEIPDELQHAQFLADKIAALDGQPITKPQDVHQTDDPKKMLENVLKAESETITRYVERRKQAEEYGDYGLVNELEDIISDETNHKEETEKILRGHWG
jgi:bacterioferritin